MDKRDSLEYRKNFMRHGITINIQDFLSYKTGVFIATGHTSYGEAIKFCIDFYKMVKDSDEIEMMIFEGILFPPKVHKLFYKCLINIFKKHLKEWNIAMSEPDGVPIYLDRDFLVKLRSNGKITRFINKF